MKEGYVAVLDVLGFADLAAGDHTGGRMNRYLESVRETMERQEIDCVVFSDSIVLNAKGEGPEPLAAVAEACSRLLRALLGDGIALRGAIAFGDFVRQSFGESVFVAGRAVIDAYRFEKAQDWIGVMLAPSAVARVPTLRERCNLRVAAGSERADLKAIEERYPWPAFIQPCDEIPFHVSSPSEPSVFDGFAIVPTSGVLEAAEISASIRAAMAKLGWLRAIAPTPGAQRKYQLTQNWLDQVLKLWGHVAYMKEQTARG